MRGVVGLCVVCCCGVVVCDLGGEGEGVGWSRRYPCLMLILVISFTVG